MKPTISNLKANPLILLIVIESFDKGYLLSYNVFYSILYKFFNKEKSNKVLLFLNILILWSIKLMTGFSKMVLVNSFFISLKFNYKFFKLDPYQHIHLNLTPIIFKDYDLIEKKRIYQTFDKKFNFNPAKPETPVIIVKSTAETTIDFIIKNTPFIEHSILYFNSHCLRANLSTEKMIGHDGIIINNFENNYFCVSTKTKSSHLLDLTTRIKSEQSEIAIQSAQAKNSIITFYSPLSVVHEKDIKISKIVNYDKNDYRRLTAEHDFDLFVANHLFFCSQKDHVLFLTKNGLLSKLYTNKPSSFFHLLNKSTLLPPLNKFTKAIGGDFEKYINPHLENFTPEERKQLLIKSLLYHNPEAAIFIRESIVNIKGDGETLSNDLSSNSL